MNALRLFEIILSESPPPFVIISRTAPDGRKVIDILLGDISRVKNISDIPLSEATSKSSSAQHDFFVLIPHSQVSERGYDAIQDEKALIALSVYEQETIDQREFLIWLPNDEIVLENQYFDIGDDEYAEIIQQVVDDQISAGSGSNFVIKRSFIADISDYSMRTALSLFRRLLVSEVGAYWTFIIHTGSTETLVGATPERHVSLDNGHVVMNPISGTYRYPAEGVELSHILNFLGDQKETEELYMVLDEELKMMAQICDGGGQVVGPLLREMAQLAHTEYYIKGYSTLDPRDILHETLLAPTVIGSPIENACRVIAQYEPKGRGYYGGVAALIGRDESGVRNMDSAILIRTADIIKKDAGNTGKISIGVGATLTRSSDVRDEVAETHGKVASLLRALGPASNFGLHRNYNSQKPWFSENSQVQLALVKRNDAISGFWQKCPTDRNETNIKFIGKRALVIDAEDNFTEMLSLLLRAIGFDVSLRSCRECFDYSNYDLVVLGPGPGDPNDIEDSRIERMSEIAAQLIESNQTPFLAVCLSHQIICRYVGLSIFRRSEPNQGLQKKIDLFGASRCVGFYNSFSAYANQDEINFGELGRMEVSRSLDTGEVYALRGEQFVSVQFHLESVLTNDNLEIMGDLVSSLVCK